jgi:hypothetical protein
MSSKTDLKTIKSHYRMNSAMADHWLQGMKKMWIIFPQSRHQIGVLWLNRYKMKLHRLVQNILTEDVLMWHICALHYDSGRDGNQEGDRWTIRKVTAEQSMHEEEVLSKILMGTNLGSLSMMLRQNFSPLNCTPTYNPKRKSCRSQNLSRTSSWTLWQLVLDSVSIGQTVNSAI